MPNTTIVAPLRLTLEDGVHLSRRSRVTVNLHPGDDPRVEVDGHESGTSWLSIKDEQDHELLTIFLTEGLRKRLIDALVKAEPLVQA